MLEQHPVDMGTPDWISQLLVRFGLALQGTFQNHFQTVLFVCNMQARQVRQVSQVILTLMQHTLREESSHTNVIQQYWQFVV